MERDKRGRFLNYPGPGRRSKSGRPFRPLDKKLSRGLGQELKSCFDFHVKGLVECRIFLCDDFYRS